MKRFSRILYVFSALFMLLFFCSSCEKSEVESPTFFGYTWRLDTPLPLSDYFTYEPGRYISFSNKGLGWIGVQKKHQYTVYFTHKVLRERPNSIEVYLHTYPDFYYYIAEMQVNEDKGSFLIFDSYEDFYQYHVHHDKSRGTWVHLTRAGRYR